MCPANYTCVMSNGQGECILAPKLQDQSTDSGGCSVGGHANPSPLFLIIFFALIVGIKRQRT
jgi:hypothetical protein